MRVSPSPPSFPLNILFSFPSYPILLASLHCIPSILLCTFYKKKKQKKTISFHYRINPQLESIHILYKVNFNVVAFNFLTRLQKVFAKKLMSLKSKAQKKNKGHKKTHTQKYIQIHTPSSIHCRRQRHETRKRGIIKDKMVR